MTLRALVLLVLPLTFAAGCAFGTAAPSSGTVATHSRSATQLRLTRYRGHGVTFTFPASWRYRHRGFYSRMTSPVVDISSQPTKNPCTPRGCWFPVRRLRRGAVVVVWEAGGGLIDPAHRPRPGVHVRIVPHGCRRLGGSKELGAQVVLRGGRIYEVYACLRGPGVAAHEREVRDMLASASTEYPVPGTE